ncbi:fumarylacetoacetate hydrolase family protein [Alteribacillus sp. JSM 102045]|uniref:fumarylacetoacetate hydrolase family protein n=1 Tax=Alteribacillus sp. JSM 102045 TaxID=1562101 RepID=UPI0035C165C1
MRIVQFYEKDGDQLHLGLRTSQGLFDITQALKKSKYSVPKTADELIVAGENGEAAVKRVYEENGTNSSFYKQETDVTYAPCVLQPEKIICIGLNYARHAEESGMDKPKEPIVFNKYANALAAHKETVTIPKEAEKVDYEAELAIVIGDTGRNIGEDEAFQYMYGFAVSNDVSARDLQFKSPQWVLGKSCDGFCPLGPELVTYDELDNPASLAIKSHVNGEIRQDSNTSDMIFNCDEIVSYVSRFMTLKPGDVILTGTPEGVIMGYPEKDQVWLKDGDVVKVEIEQLGTLENTFIAE